MLLKALLILVIDISTQCSQDIDFVVDFAKHKAPPSPKRTRSDVIGQELVHMGQLPQGFSSAAVLPCMWLVLYLVSLDLVAPISHT